MAEFSMNQIMDVLAEMDGDYHDGIDAHVAFRDGDEDNTMILILTGEDTEERYLITVEEYRP